MNFREFFKLVNTLSEIELHLSNIEKAKGLSPYVDVQEYVYPVWFDDDTVKLIPDYRLLSDQDFQTFPVIVLTNDNKDKDVIDINFILQDTIFAEDYSRVKFLLDASNNTINKHSMKIEFMDLYDIKRILENIEKEKENDTGVKIEL